MIEREVCALCLAPKATGADLRRSHYDVLGDELQEWESALCWADYHGAHTNGPPAVPTKEE